MFSNLSKSLKKSILAATVLNNPYVKQIPTPKQAKFLLNFKSEVLFGGSAGSSKSSALLMAALQFVEYPDYNAIIFRRTYSDLALPGALISRSHEWLDNTDAHWMQTEHKWMFPSGATLSFGYLDTQNSRFRYQGSEMQCICFDEVTQFELEDYTYLFSRLRKNVGSPIPLRMRSASNPGGIGHQWCYNRFFVESDPDREFIPASLRDNPYINQEEYIKSLQNLDPVTRAQLLDGNWVIQAEGNKFKQEWFQFCELNEVPQDGLVVRYWDLAATEPKPGHDPDWTVGAKVRLADGYYYIEDIVRIRSNPGDVEKTIKSIAQMDGPSVLIYIEQEPGASGKIVIDDFARRVLVGYPVWGDRPTGPKEVRANLFSAACYNRLVKLIRAPWNKPVIDECVAFPNPSIHDDAVDAISGCISKLPRVDPLQHADNTEIAFYGSLEKELVDVDLEMPL